MMTMRSQRATINGRAIDVGPNETLLQAALRQGVPFPFSCRVGGCATCRCRLVSGRVRELTETAYLLDEADIRDGAILACQSVPQTDVEIEVDLTTARPARSVAGRVAAQRRLTHDITALDVQLDQGLPYRAGQYAEVSLATLPGVVRNYSFATPARADSRVTFFVRHMPHGLFSSQIDANDLVGQPVLVDGPHGDFWLRPSAAPLLLVAGGSGLAPILALLQDAVEACVERPATLLFGARTQRDLFALEEIAQIAGRWRDEFRFVPVLSAAAEDADWIGERGRVTDHLPRFVDRETHAYLCGSPGMIDDSVERLRELGVATQHIHADRFVTRPPPVVELVGASAKARDVATAQPAAPVQGAAALQSSARIDARPFDYLKFFLFYCVGVAVAVAMVLGGAAISVALVGVIAFYVIGDGFGGVDLSTPRYQRPRVLTTLLWCALPLLAFIVFAAVWGASEGDPLSFGAWVSGWSGYDLLATKQAASPLHLLSAVALTGLMIGLIGTITAHELIHRTWDRISLLIGRALLAFSFDTVFAIEHVYGHHRYVSTEADPATAPRGRNAYVHIVASTIKGNRSAWAIERRRLRARGHAALSWRNAVIRGHAASLALVAAAWGMGGWRGAAFFVACALWGKSLLEIVNYMEHYGLVRVATSAVQPHHSWNSNHRVSSWSSFNLTRHSHHHAQGELPYHELRPFPDAPMMLQGYLTTILLALVPPVWHRLMTPKLLEWDKRWANDAERALAAAANARSGIRGLEAAGRPPAGTATAS
jgi:NAD(P)H-flavin reductase/ferredoxin